MFACRLCSNLGSKIVQTPKSLASMLKNIVSYPPLTHAFLKWPFLTDFKKYTHTPPYGTKFWCSGRKMEKTLRIHEFAPRWHVMNVPERFVFIGNLVLAVLELTVGPQYVTPKVYAFTGFWRAAFYWMNINVTQMITYIMVAVTYQQMQNGKRRLEESKREVDALSAELAEQQETLELQQQLTQKLIHNVFPQRVSEALIDLVRSSATDKEDEANALQAIARRSPVQQAWRERDSESVGSIAVPKYESQLSIYPAPMEYVADVQSVGSVSSVPDPPVMPDFAAAIAPKAHDFAVVLFADMVGFTALASQLDPTTLVHFLDQFFGDVDDYCQSHGVEKIKTIGDCYLCVAWEDDPHTQAQTQCAQRLFDVAHRMHHMAHHRPFGRQRLLVRAGMHAGPVISGIIGKTKFAFDVWGDTVNVASSMETTGLAGTTHVTAEVYELLKLDETFVPRGSVVVKGKGELVTYITPPHKPCTISPDIDLANPTDTQQFNAVDVLMKLMVTSQNA